MGKNRNYLKYAAIILWASVGICFFVYKDAHGYKSIDVVRQIYLFVEHSSYAPLIYVIVYALRPFVVLPAVLLTILSASLFGFWWGILYTILGENISANVAYFMGKFLGEDIIAKKSFGRLSMYIQYIDSNGFVVVLFMRLAYLPFDLVNFCSGALGIPWLDYAVATFIGILPGLITFVTFGFSVNIEEFLASSGHLNMSEILDAKRLAASISLLIISLILAWIVHQWPRTTNQNERELPS